MFALGGARAVFTNRRGGVSQAPYDTLNLGPHVGDDPAAVAQNRRIVDDAIGHEVVWMKQTHSARVERVRAGYTHLTPVADSLVVDVADFRRVGLGLPALGVMVADCVPVLIASDDGRYLAAVHAGRAGVVNNIVAETCRVLRRCGVSPDRLHAAVGPCICARCYEVPADLRTHVSQLVPAAWATTRRATPSLDLRSAVVAQLREVGCNVAFISKRCTAEDTRLYSYRRDGTTGRFAGIIMP